MTKLKEEGGFALSKSWQRGRGCSAEKKKSKKPLILCKPAMPNQNEVNM